jgi:hypothetical protein
MQTLADSKRKYPEELTQALVKVEKLTPELMADESAMVDWGASLVELLRQNPDANPAVQVVFDQETKVYVPEITLLLKGVAEKIALPLKLSEWPRVPGNFRDDRSDSRFVGIRRLCPTR